MKFLLKGDEQSIAEIAGKAFTNLSAADRVKAEAALLKANPELRTIAKIPPGTLIRIPASARTFKPNKDKLVDPVEGMVGNVIRELKALETEIKKSQTKHERRLKEYPENLKAARRALKGHPDGEAITNRLAKHLNDSKSSDDKNMKRGLDALKRMRKTVSTLDV